MIKNVRMAEEELKQYNRELNRVIKQWNKSYKKFFK